MDVKEGISNEKIFKLIEDIQSTIQSLKESSQKQYMRNRYRQSGAFGISIILFAMGLITASVSDEPAIMVAVAIGILIAGIVQVTVSIMLLTRAQKDNFVPPHNI